MISKESFAVVRNSDIRTQSEKVIVFLSFTVVTDFSTILYEQGYLVMKVYGSKQSCKECNEHDY